MFFGLDLTPADRNGNKLKILFYVAEIFAVFDPGSIETAKQMKELVS